MLAGDNSERGPLRRLGQLGLGENVTGFLTGSGVYVEVLEEDLRVAGIGSAALVVVGTLDVDGRGHRGVRISEGCGLAIGTGDTVALRLGSLDDELQVGHIAGDSGQLERHLGRAENDGRSIRSDNAGEGRRSGHDLTAAVHDPIVESHKEVRTDDLRLGTQDGLALCGIGRGIPGEDLGIGETLPGLRELLEHSFDGGLVQGPDGTTVTTIADVLATARLSSGDTLCGARYFVEGD